VCAFGTVTVDLRNTYTCYLCQLKIKVRKIEETGTCCQSVLVAMRGDDSFREVELGPDKDIREVSK
jgi:hypothetical protein